MWCVRACGGDVCDFICACLHVCLSVCVHVYPAVSCVCVYRMCYALMVEEATVLITL